MKRWNKLTALSLGGLLAIGGIVAGPATPAEASVISDIYCELAVDGYPETGQLFRITALAYYTDDSDTGLRRWTSFRYRLSGELNRTSNNVNIRVSESGRRIWSYNSPDNRKSHVWYSQIPSTPVYTSIYGPSGEHDHRSNDLIEFEATFDKFMEADPRCTAWVKK